MSADSLVVVVSGGSRGLGQGLVADLLARGHSVATFSRSKTPFLEECLQRYASEGRFLWQAIDISDLEKVRAFAMDAYKRFGRLDALINNAGVALDGLLSMMKEEDMQKVLTNNLVGPLHLTQVCAKLMLLRRKGSIVNVTSIMGMRGYAGVSVYSATKAALDGMTRSLARELGGANIRVNSVAPGYLKTDMVASITDQQREQILRRTPLGRLGEVEDVVGVVRFLLSDDAAYITGHTLVVDGGVTC